MCFLSSILLGNGIFLNNISLLAEQENQAVVNSDVKEQENKCKKDTECENENELNNQLSIVNKTQTETGTGQLTVIKEVICQVGPGDKGFTDTVFQDTRVMTNILYVPIGNGSPCHKSEITSQFEPQDFECTVTGNNPDPSTFPGSSSGVVVTLGVGSYDVEETDNVPSTIDFWTVNVGTVETEDCSDTISTGESKTCTFTNVISLND